MKISEARSVTGYTKVSWCEYSEGCSQCDYCKCTVNRVNSLNEKKTSYEYEEYSYACNKCVKGMADAIENGVDLVVGMF